MKQVSIYSENPKRSIHNLSQDDLHLKRLEKSLRNSKNLKYLDEEGEPVRRFKARKATKIPSPQKIEKSINNDKKNIDNSITDLKEMIKSLDGVQIYENNFREFKTKLAKSLCTLPLGLNTMRLEIMKSAINASNSVYDLKIKIAEIVKALETTRPQSPVYGNLMPR